MSKSEQYLCAAILSGGTGSRLWPVSRELHPKPFIRMADGRSLLQKTYLRASALPSVNEILTVTNHEQYFKTRDEYAPVNENGLPNAFILEPFGRNTAPAVALAAMHAAEQSANALVLVMPSDHLIHDQRAFSRAVDKAIELANDGYLVTFGVLPAYPETGYGYIEADGHVARRFIEKPLAEEAEKLLSLGNYLWNSGMFCFRADILLEEMAAHSPDLLARVSACYLASVKNAENPGDRLDIDPQSFREVDDISIDYALMEKSERVAVVRCDFDWSDIGSWKTLSDMETADEQGNRIIGNTVRQDVSNCYIRSENRMIGCIGVEDLIIVDTVDALLVTKRDRSQDVRGLVEQLKASGHESYQIHSTVHRPWGTYTVLEEGPGFKIKRIVVKPGRTLSLQMHHHRSEHWVVVSGTAQVVNDEREFLINKNESTFIPAGHKHRLSNPVEEELVLIEIQSGDYLGEDDIVRFEDKYGRTTA